MGIKKIIPELILALVWVFIIVNLTLFLIESNIDTETICFFISLLIIIIVIMFVLYFYNSNNIYAKYDKQRWGSGRK